MFDITQEINGIGLYLTNCLSQEDIDLILKHSQSPKLKRERMRIGEFTELSRHTKGEEAIAYEKVNAAIEKAMDIYIEYYGLNLDDYTMADKVYWIKVWDVGVGIGHHQDSWEHNGKEMVPAVTVLLYLSSDYEGGETIFVNEPLKDDPEKDLAIKPVAGSMIAFQSQIMHRVSPVTAGVRISTDINYMK
jgi:predicted 2-oxoglutarate/Fe(II)-dependent dioxygenase YbiX